MSFADFPRSAYVGGTAILPVVKKKSKTVNTVKIPTIVTFTKISKNVHLTTAVKVGGQAELKSVVS